MLGALGDFCHILPPFPPCLSKGRGHHDSSCSSAPDRWSAELLGLSAWFTLTFDMQTQGSVPLKPRELIPTPLRPLSYLSSHLQIAGRLALEGSLAIIYSRPWIRRWTGRAVENCLFPWALVPLAGYSGGHLARALFPGAAGGLESGFQGLFF